MKNLAWIPCNFKAVEKLQLLDVQAGILTWSSCKHALHKCLVGRPCLNALLNDPHRGEKSKHALLPSYILDLELLQDILALVPCGESCLKVLHQKVGS